VQVQRLNSGQLWAQVAEAQDEQQGKNLTHSWVRPVGSDQLYAVPEKLR
jgi:hypothetical protein